MSNVVCDSDIVTAIETRMIYESIGSVLNDPRLDIHSMMISDGLTIVQVI